MLDEGVVAGPEDIDLCMILGAGWPMFLGGITPYLDRVGASERVNGKRFLAPGVASGGGGGLAALPNQAGAAARTDSGAGGGSRCAARGHGTGIILPAACRPSAPGCGARWPGRRRGRA